MRMRNNASVGETSAANIHISLLGGFSVAVAGRPVAGHWRLRKAKTLVKLLALAPGHRLHREVVLEVMWPDADPLSAANNLHQLLHSVRRMIGPSSIALVDDVVRLGPAGGLTVDVDIFEQAAVSARRGTDIAALQHASKVQNLSRTLEEVADSRATAKASSASATSNSCVTTGAT